MRNPMKHPLRLNLQYFAEGAESAPATTQSDTSTAPETQASSAAAVDYEALSRSDKALQSWLDGKLSKAAQTAVTNARSKWEQLQSDQVSESEKLKAMTAEEKAEYYRRKLDDAQTAQSRAESARGLEKQTGELFAQHGIPTELLCTLDFQIATAESVKERVKLLSKYEYYPKGAFEQKVKQALDEKLQQKPPQTAGGSQSVTKEQFAAMTYRQRAQLAQTSPETYKTLKE